MDRQYLREHTVIVYNNQSDKDNNKPLKTIYTRPYSHWGFENYKHDGLMYPGFIDPHHPHADACIILSVIKLNT